MHIQQMTIQHTYLKTTKNFYEALDELMNYVQNPYFTDQNVEKKRNNSPRNKHVR